jgi:hypothetical protein
MKKIMLAVLLAFSFFHRAHAAYPSYTDLTNVCNALIAASGGGGSGGLGAGVPVKSPNLYWTNNVFRSFWTTNANFTNAQVGLASSNFYVAQITISNSAATSITDTFPFKVFSVSAKTNVGAVLIGAGAVVDLQFYYNGSGAYFVVDHGANNPALTALAASGAAGSSGVLTLNAGTLQVNPGVQLATNVPSGISITNPVIATITTAATEFLAQQTGDTFGTSRLHLQNRTPNYGALLENLAFDLCDLALIGNTANQGNLRFEHRSGSVTSGNISGELQGWLNNASIQTFAFGSNSASIYSPLYSPQIIITNIGLIYGSNTWNIVSVTNRMPNFSFQTLNSNGQALVSVSVSNGVTRIKQLAP